MPSPKLSSNIGGRRGDLSLASITALRPGRSGCDKKFTPNLHAKRPSKNCAPSSTLNGDASKSQEHASKPDGQVWSRPKRPQPKLVQSMDGTFASGISGPTAIRRHASGSEFTGRSGEIERPVLGSAAERAAPVDVEEENSQLKALLRDDFLSVADMESLQGQTLPVALPLIHTGTSQLSDKSTKDGSKKRPRLIADSGDEANTHDSPSPRSERHIRAKKMSHQARKKLSFVDLVKQQRGDLLLIQAPPVWPFCSAQGDNLKPVSLEALPDGYLGKIQIHKSGKCRLLPCAPTVQDTATPPVTTHNSQAAVFDVDTGTAVDFVEHVATVQDNVVERRPNTDCRPIVPDLTVLGQVKQHVTISPNWHALAEAMQSDQR